MKKKKQVGVLEGIKWLTITRIVVATISVGLLPMAVNVIGTSFLSLIFAASAIDTGTVILEMLRMMAQAGVYIVAWHFCAPLADELRKARKPRRRSARSNLKQVR